MFITVAVAYALGYLYLVVEAFQLSSRYAVSGMCRQTFQNPTTFREEPIDVENYPD